MREFRYRPSIFPPKTLEIAEKQLQYFVLLRKSLEYAAERADPLSDAFEELAEQLFECCLELDVVAHAAIAFRYKRSH